MSTTPSAPPPEPPPHGYGYGARGPNPLAGMAMPNPELLIWALVVIIVGIIALTSDSVNADHFVTSLTVLTLAYLLSRGIAKASRVLEH